MGVGRLSELLQLLESRLLRPGCPFLQGRELRVQVRWRHSRSVTCPGQQLASDRDPHRHGLHRSALKAQSSTSGQKGQVNRHIGR